MLFKKRLKEKANKSFDKLIVDPSFISQKLLNKPVAPRNNKKLFVPIFSASLALALIGAITITAVVRNNIAINNENARIRDEEDNYIKPFAGKYGIYLSFWQITDMKNPNNSGGILHNYHAVHVVFGEVVEEGWIEYYDTESKKTETPSLNFRGQQIYDDDGKAIMDKHTEIYNRARVHFANDSTREIKLNVESGAVKLGNEEWDEETDDIWGRMPFIGTYKSNDGKTIEVKQDATMVEETKKGTKVSDCFVIKYKKEKISINYTEEVKKNKLESKQMDVELVGDKYQFTKDGVTYIREA